MDLNELTPKQTIAIELKHPGNGEPLLMPDVTPMTCTVYTPYSQRYKDAIYEQADKRLKKAASGKNVQMTSSELEKASLDMLVETIYDWNIFVDGEVPKLTKQSATEVLTKFPWIKQQINAAQDDQAGFFND